MGAGGPAMDLYTREEAAKRLRVSKDMLYKMRKAGKLSCHKIGDLVYFTQGDLDEFVESCRVPAVAESGG